MSKKANPTVIGLFTLSGFSLTVIAVILFASSSLFSKTFDSILYFDESVNGLEVGAPVKFKGVSIGQVKQILIADAEDKSSVLIPIIITINQDVVESYTQKPAVTDPVKILDSIKQGLRGKLEQESFVTGRLFIDLDFYTDAEEPKFYGLNKEIPEIPTLRTDLAVLMDHLKKVDIAGITEKLNSILGKMDDGFEGLDFKNLTLDLTETMNSVKDLVSSPEIKNTIVSIGKTSDEFRMLSERVREKIGPMSDNAESTLGDLNLVLAEMKQTIAELNDLIKPGSPLTSRINSTMNEVERTARSIRQLSDYLNRNPKALISGKPLPGKSR